MEKLVGVCPSLNALPQVLRAALARLFPVRFDSASDGGDPAAWDAALLVGEASTLPRACPAGLRCFRAASGEEPAANGAGDSQVQFSSSPVLDGRLRNRTLPHQKLPPVCPGPVLAGDEILARLDGTPVWVRRPSPCWDIVALSLPEFKDGEQAFDYLNDGNYLRLLPLVHFLRQVTAGAGWEPPPLRACLMFDDPNLHWRSYGFLDYRRTVALARQGGFHVTLATVPVDAWGAHGQTVRLFRDNPGQLSLLFHGNDHLREELGRERPAAQHLQLWAQALARVARLESSTGLRVARAMAPPHEAYVQAGLAAMFALGFEGAFISPWSLRHWAPQQAWPPAFGLEPAELMADGFPVLPRFRLSAACEVKVVLAAFLDRPVVPVGHHYTVADGLELLARTADLIASLGPVRWGGPEMLLQSNFASRREGGVLAVRPYAVRIRLTVPAGVSAIRLAPPCDRPFRVAVAGERSGARAGGVEPVPVRAGEEVEVVAEGLGAVDYAQVARPGFSWWAMPRRVLCEVRDRMQPVFYRVRRKAARAHGGV